MVEDGNNDLNAYMLRIRCSVSRTSDDKDRNDMVTDGKSLDGMAGFVRRRPCHTHSRNWTPIFPEGQQNMPHQLSSCDGFNIRPYDSSKLCPIVRLAEWGA